MTMLDGADTSHLLFLTHKVTHRQKVTHRLSQSQSLKIGSKTEGRDDDDDDKEETKHREDGDGGDLSRGPIRFVGEEDG